MPHEARDLRDDTDRLAADAAHVLRQLQGLGMSLATAESCTGGLLASLFTDLEGLSNTFERGLVTYSEAAKSDLLGVEPILLRRHGAVSAETAEAMVEGVLAHSPASVACAVTGYAGKTGKGAGDGEEAGLVHIAVKSRTGPLIHRECHFGERPRDEVRYLAARAALEMLEEVLEMRAG